MSKLIDNIKVEMTGSRKPGASPLLSVSMAVEKLDYKIPVLTEYRVYVNFGARFACESQVEVNMAIESVIRALREELYSDIKDRIFRLEKVVIEGERQKILMELRDIIREIYGN